MKIQCEIFQLISDLISSTENSETALFDMPIVCRDGTLYWSRFLFAASSKFMKELLKNQDESCLILHDFDRNHVLTALENLIKKSDSSDGEDIYNILKFDKEIVPSNVKLDVSSTKKLFKCNVKNCSTVFQRLRHFQRHVASHTKNSQYVCEQCGKVFYHEDNLKLHMRYHQDVLDIHTCPHCQYDFHGRRALQCHIDDQHTPQVSCPICKKNFKKRMLLRHVRSKHANDANKKVNNSYQNNSKSKFIFQNKFLRKLS